MSLYSRNQKRLATLTLTVLLGMFLLWGLSNYLVALFGSVVFYKLFQKPFDYLTKTRNWNRHLVVILIIVFSLIILVLPFFGLSLMLAKQIVKLSKNQEQIQEVVKDLREFVGNASYIPENTISNVIDKASTWLSQAVPNVVNGALDIFITIAILYFVMYYMFIEEDRFKRLVKRFSPFSEKTNKELDKEMQNVVFSNILGQGFISLVQGGTMALGFWIFGLNNPLLWGMVGFFASFLPVLGTPLVWWPAALILLANGDYFNGVGLILYGFLITTQIDNVLRFLINKWVGDIHPLITVLGVLFGLPLFGILGLVIGPLTISYFLLLLRAFYAEFNQEGDDFSIRISR